MFHIREGFDHGSRSHRGRDAQVVINAADDTLKGLLLTFLPFALTPAINKKQNNGFLVHKSMSCPVFLPYLFSNVKCSELLQFRILGVTQ
ncbi:hypothetical protein D3C76_1397920 [compost metagenome]